VKEEDSFLITNSVEIMCMYEIDYKNINIKDIVFAPISYVGNRKCFSPFFLTLCCHIKINPCL
jgi:hypothetical protein